MIEHYTITKTLKRDLDRACELFAGAITYQKARGYPQYLHTDRAGVKKAIEEGLHFKVMVGDEIAAVFNILFNDRIIWRHHEIGNAVYLHRIITNQKYKGNLLFEKIRDWAEETLCKKHRRKVIRLDTWANNPNLIKYYERFGFEIIEYFTMPTTPELSSNHWGSDAVLMEYKVNGSR